jgi:hypothetical protein
VDLERLHRVLIVRRHKDCDRHLSQADLFKDLKPSSARHLNVEKKQVDSTLF